MGPLLEQNLRQSLLMSGGDFTIFVSRPISGVTLAIAFLLLLSNLLPFMKKRRAKVEEILKEE
jgi:putative tricarboxylic transport membrane protein